MRLCSIDVESTGTNVATDRIIQLGIVDIDGDLIREHDFRCNPGVPIPPTSTAIHGFTDVMVKDYLPFAQQAKIIASILKGADLLGFNLLNFDVPIIWEELHRAGVEWDVSAINIIDVGVIFKKMQPRTLAAAVKTYCGTDHEAAHDAVADALATYYVLCGQRAAHPELENLPNDALAKLSQYSETRIDLAGKLVRNADGEAVYGFGKVKGTRVKDNMGFARWMLYKDFSANTLLHVQREIEAIEASWTPEPLNSDDPF